MTIRFLSALALSAAVVSPVHAGQYATVPTEAVIHLKDINLASEQGQLALKARSARAIAIACNPSARREIESHEITRRCRTDMAAKLNVRLASLIEGRGLRRYALADTTAPSPR